VTHELETSIEIEEEEEEGDDGGDEASAHLCWPVCCEASWRA
jgi:hypothetical protein